MSASEKNFQFFLVLLNDSSRADKATREKDNFQFFLVLL